MNNFGYNSGDNKVRGYKTLREEDLVDDGEDSNGEPATDREQNLTSEEMEEKSDGERIEF